MRNYTVDNPSFHREIKVTETTDPGHADNVNAGPMELLENTLVNHKLINASLGLDDDYEIEEYDPDKTYHAGDVVMKDGVIYVCTEETTGDWDESCWGEESLQNVQELAIEYDKDSETLTMSLE